jgi:glycosyltransferase involved in cell wall biosynthesis
VNDPHVLSVALVSVGDPAAMTGGYLYHRRVAERAEANHARIRFVCFPQRLFPLSMLAARKVLRAVVRLRPDVVLLDSLAAAYIAPWFSPWWRPPVAGRPPLVGMLHQPPGGIDHGPVRRRIQSVLDRYAYRRAARLLVASDDLAATMRGEGVPAHLLRVLRPGRDPTPDTTTDRVEPPAGAALRAGRRASVLSVGNWVARKGLLDLLEAVAALPPDAVTLHLVGDSGAERSYSARVRARIAAPDLADRVVVHGSRTPAEVAGLYRSADVFALTSVREPYGTVYGEAMAAGLPVVGWRAGNLPHLVRHGVEGMTVAPGDRPGLTAALQSLATDESLRRRMGSAAAQRAATLPTWDETAATLFAELRAVADEARGFSRPTGKRR